MQRWFTVAMLMLVLFATTTGCLSFGKDEETTSPTESQVMRCRAEMYLNDSVEITPLGFKLLGSGIDDAIWFKFETSADDLSQVFDTSIVDTSEFEENATILMYEVEGLDWWDVDGRDFLGGQVSLPNARFMNVGAVKVDEGYVIYVFWNET